MQESETLEAQNHQLKTQISRLEEEKRRLMEILSVHEPGCSKQLKLASGEELKQEKDEEEVGSGPPHETISFRVPAPPPPPSSSSSSFRTTEAIAATTTSLSAPQQQQQQFSSFFPVEDVKPQILLNDAPLVGGDGQVGFFPAGMSPVVEEEEEDHFLAKRPPVYNTYLDLDSRCVAL